MLHRLRRLGLPLALCLLVVTPGLYAKEKTKKGGDAASAAEEEAPLLSSGTFAGLSFRGIGPAVTSGRN